jgi:6-phosphogluconolactonase/glucosamine-6-phosphate isomerase/deaminase
LHPKSDHIKAAGDGTVTFGIHKDGKNQIAISMDVMCAAKKVILAATGAKKADAIKMGLSGSFEPHMCPAGLVKAKETIWYGDKASLGDFKPA